MRHFLHHQSTPLPLAAIAVLILGILAAPCRADEAAAAEPGDAEEGKKPETEEKAPELSAEEVNALIDDLASDDFATRESAQKKLGEVTMASGLAETVRQRYLRAENPEVKLRLRRVLYEVARMEFLGRKKAFLGIQMQDSVIVGGKTGREMILSIMVLSVIPDSAAEEHDVNYGDHILTVNGEGFKAAPAEEFKGMIGAHAAGDTIKLKLRRGGVITEKKVVLGEMPDSLAGSIGQSRAAFEPYFLLWLEKGGEIKRP